MRLRTSEPAPLQHSTGDGAGGLPGRGAASPNDARRGDHVGQRILAQATGIATRQSTDVLMVRHADVRKALRFIRENVNRAIRVTDSAFLAIRQTRHRPHPASLPPQDLAAVKCSDRDTVVESISTPNTQHPTLIIQVETPNLGVGCWLLGVGCWTLGVGRWAFNLNVSIRNHGWTATSKKVLGTWAWA